MKSSTQPSTVYCGEATGLCRQAEALLVTGLDHEPTARGAIQQDRDMLLESTNIKLGRVLVAGEREGAVLAALDK